MSAKHLIEQNKQVVEALLDPDEHADAAWMAGVDLLEANRVRLRKLGFNAAALGTTPGGLTHFIYWLVADNGTKLQFEEPQHGDQWFVSIVCPPPRFWRKVEKQKVAGVYVPASEVERLSGDLKTRYHLDGIDPKGILRQLTAHS